MFTLINTRMKNENEAWQVRLAEKWKTQFMMNYSLNNIVINILIRQIKRLWISYSNDVEQRDTDCIDDKSL